MAGSERLKQKAVFIIKRLKKISLVFFGIFLLGCLELACRVVLPDSKLNIIESIHVICQEDVRLLWRQRLRIHTVFQGVDVRTNSLGVRHEKEIVRIKPPHTRRIICLGASSTFGWGVAKDRAYPQVLSKLLCEKYPREKFEVINAGQIGYTTYQGKLFLKECLLGYQPDVVTVSYILNDIDSCRFFRHEKSGDNELRYRNAVFLRFENMVMKSRIYFLLKRIAARRINSNVQMNVRLLKKQFVSSQIRVTPQQYKRNLEDIIYLSRRQGIHVVFIVMPVNLSKPELTAAENDKEEKGISLSQYYYEQGCRSESAGNYEEACLLLKRALDYQVLKCDADAQFYQDIMKRTAQEHGVPLVDVAAAFKQQGDPEKLFNGKSDMIHPSAQGHMLIAGILYETIRKQVLK